MNLVPAHMHRNDYQGGELGGGGRRGLRQVGGGEGTAGRGEAQQGGAQQGSRLPADAI